MRLGRKCKVCHSPYREEIDQKLLESMPVRKLSDWLLVEKSYKCDFMAISRHRPHIEGYEVLVAEAQKRQAEAEVALRKATELADEELANMIADVAMVDRLARRNMQIVQMLGRKFLKHDPTMANAQLYNGACATVLRCAQVRQSLTGVKETNGGPPTFNVQIVAPVRPDSKESAVPVPDAEPIQ